MDKTKVTPKDFFLWAGAMLALYVGVFNYIALLWDYINYTFPDPLQYYVDPYQSGISWEMATLIVLTPLFLFLMWYIHRDISRDSSRNVVWIRRWALYLTIFLAGITIAVDLIWVLYAFLNGTDLTPRFLLKATVVLCVAAIGFMHFMADLWGYWQTYPLRNRAVACAIAVLVMISIAAGFFIVGTPQHARSYRYDNQKVSDLQQIQSQVISYWQAKGALPASLADLNDSISGFVSPNDPQTGESYIYRRNSPLDFSLCATFNAPTQGNSVPSFTAPAPYGATGASSDNWQHGGGTACFDRSINPQRYSPQTKATQ